MYHMNPNSGEINPCHASTIEQCPYYNINNEANHYETLEKAEKARDKKFSNQFGIFFGMRKNIDKKFEKEVADSYNIISKIPATLKEYKFLVDYANDRKMNPRILKTVADRLIEEKNDTEENKNRIAMVMEAYMDNKNYKSLTEHYTKSQLGRAIRVTKEVIEKDENTPQFSLSATAFGKIASFDFDPRREDRPEYLKRDFDRTVYQIDSGYKPNLMFEKEDDTKIKQGAAYRGIVWERKIRDDFSADHPEYKVYESFYQYRSNDTKWVNGFVDGIYGNPKTGKPIGILEIKTGNSEHWKDGIPLNYRAQTLYYLHMTGLKEAKIRYMDEKYKTHEYDLNINSPISPNHQYTIQEYLSQRIAPLTRSITNKTYPAIN